MRKTLIFLLFFGCTASVLTVQALTPAQELTNEVNAILEHSSSAQISAMSLGDFEKIAGQISIAYQKYDYIQRSRAASLMLPGLGQFKNGDALGGSLFLAGDLAVVAGTLVGAYFLLPSNVQFGSLDYLNAPLATWRTTWQSNSLLSYLPSAGVLLGGMLVQGALRWISAENAMSEARRSIASGKVTFEPKLVPVVGPMGMGMMMRFRY
jgi:hypothetical protein